MSSIRSAWTSAINVSAAFNSAVWAGAGQLTLSVGSMLVKNDNQFLYVALDLTGDTGNGAGASDYFWLTFDVDRNRAITKNVDVNYGTYPTPPLRIGRQLYLGAGSWTGLLATTAAVNETFGPSTASATPHRIWQIRIPLSEIKVTIGSLPQTVPIGLRVSSTTPAFTVDTPTGFDTDFANLIDLIFALGPSDPFGGLAGVTMGGVGNVPATTINATTGRATTASSYVPYVQNAAFGGTLNILGNNVTMENLWAAGARKYLVLHRVGTSGAFTHFRQTWSNYQWVGTTYVLESFGPDSSDMYPLLDPSGDYSIQKLLLQWSSLGAINGIHQFEVQFFNASGVAVASPAQTLTLLIDNSAPDVEILGLTYGGKPITPCQNVTVTAAGGPVSVQINAADTAGDLYAYSLTALYGSNQSVSLASVGYPGGNWAGVTNSNIVCPATFPPTTCAYTFVLGASKRVTDGYEYLGYWQATDSVTLTKG